MTAWGPHVIAKLARDAGFRGELVHDATALALATSGGADHYSHNPTAVPCTERRGLWAIRVDQVPDDMQVDLYTPADSAAVLRRLWADSGESFAWHPTWINGAAARERQWVVHALTGRDDPRNVKQAVGFGETLARMVNLANAYGQKLDTGQVLHD